MPTFGLKAVKSHWSSLLDRVEQGETITIARRGVPFAVLTPPPHIARSDIQESIRALLEFRKGRRLGRDSVHAMISEGRR
jgi:prevent-host-death family protein